MGVSLADSSVTSSTPGVLVKGTVDPRQIGNLGSVIIVEAPDSVRRISDVIDPSYVEGGGAAYWTDFQLGGGTVDGQMTLRLNTVDDEYGVDAGPQFTATALANLFVVVFYGAESAAWDGDELDNSDMVEPYQFSAASVTAAGPTNDSTLRAAINNDSTVIAMLVDSSHPNIDIANLEIADPPAAPTAPTVSSTGTSSISVALSADPTSDSPHNVTRRPSQEDKRIRQRLG